MKKIKGLAMDLAEKMNVPADVLPGMGSISVKGGRQALVEDHRGIIEYSDQQITVALKRGKLIISGSDLSLCAMSAGELLVKGRIRNIEWC